LGPLATGLNGPSGPAFDSNGNLYVANYYSSTISEFNLIGDLVKTISTPNLSLPDALAFDAAGNLYVSNWGNGTIEKISPTGDDLGYFVKFMNGPVGVAFDSSGDLYAVNFVGSTISKISPNGTLIETISDSSLGYPTFITIQGQSLPVPEVSTWMLVTMGFAVFFGFFRRRSIGC
jgi:DNA-binding beta-propeller fold protein YncE